VNDVIWSRIKITKFKSRLLHLYGSFVGWWSIRFVGNVGKFLPKYTTSHPTVR